MQVSVETTQGLQRRMTVEVPAEQIDGEVKNRLSSLAKRVRISGFRPGKVPLGVVKKQYGQQVMSEVLSEVVQNTFYEAVSQEKLRLAGVPQIEPKNRNVGEKLEYTATFEVYPDIKLKPLDKLTVERPAVEITEADVAATIEKIRAQRLDWNEVERTSASGDRVTIDFTGRVDGEEFPGGSATDFQVELGQGRMLPGFEENLEGQKAGDTTTFDLKFPDDYFGKEVAGKTAQFEVTTKKVEASSLPDINEDFIKGLGIEAGTVEVLHEDIRNNMQRELDARLRSVIKQNVLEQLVSSNDIDLPKYLVDQEVENLVKRQGGSEKANISAEAAASYETDARRRVSLGLILSEIIKENKLTADPTAVRQEVENIASGYDQPDQVVQWYYAEKDRLNEVESLVLENQAIDWVMEQVKVKEIKQSFDQVMGLEK